MQTNQIEDLSGAEPFRNRLSKTFDTFLYLNDRELLTNNVTGTFFKGIGNVGEADLSQTDNLNWLTEQNVTLGRIILPKGIDWESFMRIAEKATNLFRTYKNQLLYMQTLGGSVLGDREIFKVLEFSGIALWRQVQTDTPRASGIYLPMPLYQDVATSFQGSSSVENSPNIFKIKDQFDRTMRRVFRQLTYQRFGEEYSGSQEIKLR